MTHPKRSTPTIDQITAATPLADAFRLRSELRDEAAALLAEYDPAQPYEQRALMDERIGARYEAIKRIDDAILSSPETGPDAARIKLTVALQNHAAIGGELIDGWEMVAAAVACLPPEAAAAAA